MIKQIFNENFSNWIVIDIALVALLLTGCMQSDLPHVSPKEAATMFAEQKAIIVDVREISEWNEQHIAGARHIPLAQIKNRLSELAKYKDSTIIVQCRSGKRSAKAAGLLKDAGFTKVYNLTGGMIAWGEDGFKMTKSDL